MLRARRETPGIPGARRDCKVLRVFVVRRELRMVRRVLRVLRDWTDLSVRLA